MKSSPTLPEYFVVNEFPLNSRVTLNEISEPLTLPSLMSVEVLPLRPGEVMEPVNLSPSTFKVSVLVAVRAAIATDPWSNCKFRLGQFFCLRRALASEFPPQGQRRPEFYEIHLIS